jgi:hypothetical protein
MLILPYVYKTPKLFYLFAQILPPLFDPLFTIVSFPRSPAMLFSFTNKLMDVN